MAEQTGKFLTELPELTTPIEDDLMYIVDDETSKRITLKNLKSVVGGEDVTGTASGAVATFIDGGDDKPLKECEVSIEATQSGSGTPSPSNVRPIVGRSEVNVSVEGKNKYKGTLYNGQINSDGSFSSNTTRVTNVQNASTLQQVLKAGTYTISASGLDYATVLTKNSSLVIVDNFAGAWHELPYTFTLTEEAYIYFTLRKSDNSTLTPSDYNVQIEEGSEATPYEPWGSITTIPLGRTVYGGILDVVRGVLTVDREMLDASLVTWVAQTNSRWFYNGIQNIIKIPPSTSTPTEAIAEEYGAISNVDMASGSNIGMAVNASGSLVIRNGSTEVEPTGLIVYPLATPQTIILTPTEVQTILGYNNISADSGDVSVVYVRDLNITINDLINRVTALENE